MRLFLVPISTRRTLIYCQRIEKLAQGRPSLIDRATARAARTWLQWERGDKAWQKGIVNLGNKVLRGIPYEEMGLRSIPPLSSRRREEMRSEKGEPVDVAFPSTIIPRQSVVDVLRKLATERQALHTSRMWWSIVAMPITAPIALIPILPNVPFFYFLFRAWSHWQALSGSKHLEFLVEHKLVRPSPSSTLDLLYEAKAKGLPQYGQAEDIDSQEPMSDNASSIPGRSTDESTTTETLLLGKEDGKVCAVVLGVPELAVEVERAVEQVEKALQVASDPSPKP